MLIVIKISYFLQFASRIFTDISALKYQQGQQKPIWGNITTSHQQKWMQNDQSTKDKFVNEELSETVTNWLRFTRLIF